MKTRPKNLDMAKVYFSREIFARMQRLYIVSNSDNVMKLCCSCNCVEKRAREVEQRPSADHLQSQSAPTVPIAFLSHRRRLSGDACERRSKLSSRIRTSSNINNSSSRVHPSLSPRRFAQNAAASSCGTAQSSSHQPWSICRRRWVREDHPQAEEHCLRLSARWVQHCRCTGRVEA